MSAAGGSDELDPQVAALLARSQGGELLQGLTALRSAYDAETAELSGPPEPVAAVEDRDAPVPLRIVRPRDARGTVLWAHGGGWLYGSCDSHEPLARALANASGARVVLPDYRLAPEHPFPAALEDCEAALAAARELGEPVAVAGDSAGGGLAAVLARRHRDVRHQALVYPVLDAHMAGASYRAYAEGYRLTAADMAQVFERYGGDPDEPDVSPLRAADLTGVPPATIVLASHDVLRDEGEAYAGRLREAGVEATVHVCAGTVHGFIRWLADVDAARAVIARLGAALRAALAG